MSPNNFLCRPCLSVMCSDCKEIASEYDELLRMRNNRILDLESQVEGLSRDLASERRLRTEFEELAKIGLPGITSRWVDSQVRGEGSEYRLRTAARFFVDFKAVIMSKEFSSNSKTLLLAFDELEKAARMGEEIS